MRPEGESSNAGSRGLLRKQLPPNAKIVDVSRFPLESALVRLDGETSNALFDVLEEWNTVLNSSGSNVYDEPTP